MSWKEREKSPQGSVRTALSSERPQEKSTKPKTSSQRVFEARAELLPGGLALGQALGQAQEKKHHPG